jgi:hypothetical protein
MYNTKVRLHQYRSHQPERPISNKSFDVKHMFIAAQ